MRILKDLQSLASGSVACPGSPAFHAVVEAGVKDVIGARGGEPTATSEDVIIAPASRERKESRLPRSEGRVGRRRCKQMVGVGVTLAQPMAVCYAFPDRDYVAQRHASPCDAHIFLYVLRRSGSRKRELSEKLGLGS